MVDNPVHVAQPPACRIDFLASRSVRVLYGSVARGEAHSESDIDVLVVADDPRTAFDVGGELPEPVNGYPPGRRGGLRSVRHPGGETVFGGKPVFDRITFDSDIMGARACIRGMRIPVSVIVSQIAHGASFEEILEEYPNLEREDIQQAIEYAAWLTREEVRSS